MATNLDPEFDPWGEALPFAERLARQELQRNWQGWLPEIVAWSQLLLKLPRRFDDILTAAERGSLTVQTSLAPDTRKTLRGLEQAINQLSWMVVAVGLLLAGVNFYTGPGGENLGIGLMGLAALAFFWGLWRTK